MPCRLFSRYNLDKSIVQLRGVRFNLFLSFLFHYKENLEILLSETNRIDPDQTNKFLDGEAFISYGTIDCSIFDWRQISGVPHLVVMQSLRKQCFDCCPSTMSTA